jgi:hypothetical protein
MLSQNYFPEPNRHAAAAWQRHPNWHPSQPSPLLMLLLFLLLLLLLLL